MTRFTFKLDPLLRVRRRTEREKQRVMADLERQRRALEDMLRKQQEMISGAAGALRDRLIGRVLVHELRGQAAAGMKLMAQAQRIVLELAALHQRIEAARAELIKATQARRAVELLREKRFAEWKRTMERRATNALDELAVQAAVKHSAHDWSES